MILRIIFIPPLSETGLLSISSEIEVPDDKALQIIEAKEKGENLMETFLEERLKENQTKDFF